MLDELGPSQKVTRLHRFGLPLPSGAPAIAIVGTRRPTLAGIEIATLLSRAGTILPIPKPPPNPGRFNSSRRPRTSPSATQARWSDRAIQFFVPSR